MKNRFNTLGTSLTSDNKISIIRPTSQKACKCFGAMCSFSRQQAPHPSPVQSDWPSEDWDGNKARTREQQSLSNFDIAKSETDKQTLYLVDTLPFQKMTIEMNELEDKTLEVSNTLVPLQEKGAIRITLSENVIKLDGTEEANKEGLIEHELHLQREEEKYALYIGILSPEESDIESEMDESEYPF